MLKFYKFTNQGFTSSYESYLVDQEFVHSILDLNLDWNSAFPKRPLVLQKLNIFNEDSESESGSDFDFGSRHRRDASSELILWLLYSIQDS
jgi:hypothetical protein